jgi:hypothetical protein
MRKAIARGPRRETIQVEFKKRSPRDHAADASAVGAQLDSIASLVKNVKLAYKKDKEFLVNARPLKGGSLVVQIELLLFDDEDRLYDDGFFDLLREMLRAFFDIRMRFGGEELRRQERIRITRAIQDENIDPTLWDMLLPSSEESRLFQRAFTFAERDASITEIRYRMPNDRRPIARVPRADFRKFQELITVETLLDPRQTSTREVLVIRSVAFDPELVWHFVWQGRMISCVIHDDEFLSRVRDRRETFRSGDRLVVQLDRTQEYDATVRTHTDKRFSITRVYEHIQVAESGQLFGGN